MSDGFFYYRRGERIAIIVLLLLLAAIAATLYFYPLGSKEAAWERLRTDSCFMQRCDSFFLTLSEQKRLGYSYADLRQIMPELTPFDPNTADSARFVELGLPGWVARNIVRYREKGGRFYKPEQFARIYGIDSLRFLNLKPFIRIDSAMLSKRHLRYESDSLKKNYTEKFIELTKVELNSADTSLLKKIPGIGSGFAAMLVGYRKQLGGFHAVRQLKEMRGVTDSLYTQWEPWFYTDRSLITPIAVNKAGIKRLRDHPYLDFYQAKVIVELRKQYHRINGWEELELLEEFTSQDIERLRPYLLFDEE